MGNPQQAGHFGTCLREPCQAVWSGATTGWRTILHLPRAIGFVASPLPNIESLQRVRNRDSLRVRNVRSNEDCCL